MILALKHDDVTEFGVSLFATNWRIITGSRQSVKFDENLRAYGLDIVDRYSRKLSAKPLRKVVLKI